MSTETEMELPVSLVVAIKEDENDDRSNSFGTGRV